MGKGAFKRWEKREAKRKGEGRTLQSPELEACDPRHRHCGPSDLLTLSRETPSSRELHGGVAFRGQRWSEGTDRHGKVLGEREREREGGELADSSELQSRD